MKHISNSSLALVAVLAMSSQAHGLIISETWNPAQEAPPQAVGGYELTAFKDLDSPGVFGTPVQQVTSPLDGSLQFSQTVRHYKIQGTSSPWETWVHRLTDDAYYYDQRGTGDLVNGTIDPLTLLLPDEANAFYLYLESKTSQTFNFSVKSSQGVDQFVLNGAGGAMGVVFFTDSALEHLKSISISNPGNNQEGFAVGEFGINYVDSIRSDEDPYSMFRTEVFGASMFSASVPDGAVSPWLISTLLLSMGALHHVTHKAKE